MPADALLRMGLGLTLVVVLILGCAWMLGRSGLSALRQQRRLREIEALRLGPRQKISVLEIDGTWLVVGVSVGQMTLLHSQPAGAPEELCATSSAPFAATASSSTPFTDLLTRARGRG
jgi:flagellar protein FliO/FliZ